MHPGNPQRRDHGLVVLSLPRIVELHTEIGRQCRDRGSIEVQPRPDSSEFLTRRPLPDMHRLHRHKRRDMRIYHAEIKGIPGLQPCRDIGAGRARSCSQIQPQRLQIAIKPRSPSPTERHRRDIATAQLAHAIQVQAHIRHTPVLTW